MEMAKLYLSHVSLMGTHFWRPRYLSFPEAAGAQTILEQATCAARNFARLMV
jgi:hypothetical protein